ncbi:50S ribosomal protein L35 [Candidatus Fokinia crypta]|uniref:Large ribosomal subunit protein bL35 n=1 Tax=Candidatus Fokinia crypta TaxID=1920990 RepID=A0ABZ0UU90_9RICK|nr:50S ribosomal protein L35 [Candidatus Fokinia cryptica]WPX97640.1 50S ribosomal protein L35 [Candidatus Fokinia cryptica]
MPKLKTKSSVKKRFFQTATGKIRAGQANKRHNMRKRSARQLREQRGTCILPEMERIRIKQYIPYGL